MIDLVSVYLGSSHKLSDFEFPYNIPWFTPFVESNLGGVMGS